MKFWIKFRIKLKNKFRIKFIEFRGVCVGKGQNVENHFVKSQKKNIESIKFEKDQNVKSQIRLSTF
jgi:hypothetical protein